METHAQSVLVSTHTPMMQQPGSTDWITVQDGYLQTGPKPHHTQPYQHQTEWSVLLGSATVPQRDNPHNLMNNKANSTNNSHIGRHDGTGAQLLLPPACQQHMQTNLNPSMKVSYCMCSLRAACLTFNTSTAQAFIACNIPKSIPDSPPSTTTQHTQRFCNPPAQAAALGVPQAHGWPMALC